MWLVLRLLLLAQSLLGSELSTVRNGRNKLSYHNIQDVFYQNPQRYSAANDRPFTRTTKPKNSDNREVISTRISPTGWVTKCRGLECVSTVSSSTASNFLNKALNALDKFQPQPSDTKKNLYKPESSLAKALATTSGVEKTRLQKDGINSSRTSQKSNGKYNDNDYFFKRQNWLGIPRGHHVYSPHFGIRNRPGPMQVMDPFYSNGMAGNIHPAHSGYHLHHFPLHGHMVHHGRSPTPFMAHRRHPQFNRRPLKLEEFNDGPIPPYPDLPGILPETAVNFPVHHYPHTPIAPEIIHHTPQGDFPMDSYPDSPTVPGIVHQGLDNNFAAVPPILPGIVHHAIDTSLPVHHYPNAPMLPIMNQAPAIHSFSTHHITGIPGIAHQSTGGLPGHHFARLPGAMSTFMHHQSLSMPVHHFQGPPLHQVMPHQEMHILGPSQVVPEEIHLQDPAPAVPQLMPVPGPLRVEVHKLPFPIPYPVPSPPVIKEVPIPIKVPVKEPPEVQKYYYPVGIPQPGQIHHVPFPVYIRQPPRVAPYFVRVLSPPQKIPFAVPSPPKVVVQRVPYPIIIPRPVHVVHQEARLYTANSGHCKINPCINGGTCSAFKDYYKCHCQEGYKGVHCEEQSKCHPNPCKNLGICTELEKEYECTCQPGYKGINCEAPDPCTPTPCKNGGICAQVGSSYDCQCKIGWIGRDCGIESKCLPINPCRNSGVCTEALGTYHCNCLQGWQGLNCELLGQSPPQRLQLTGHVINLPTGGCGRCHLNAYCNQGRCVCEPGFIGNGFVCDAIFQHRVVSRKNSYYPYKRQNVLSEG